MGPPPKKRKIAKKGEEIIMIPVAADDFKKMNVQKRKEQEKAYEKQVRAGQLQLSFVICCTPALVPYTCFNNIMNHSL